MTDVVRVRVPFSAPSNKYIKGALNYENQKRLFSQRSCWRKYRSVNRKREVDFDYIIHLNDSAKLLFEALMEDDLEEKDLVNILLDNYEVEEDVAAKDVSEFVEMLKLNDII